MKIRKMTKDDLLQVIELDKECFISPWDKTQFLYELEDNPFSTILVLENQDKIIGMIDYWITFETGQINQIAISKEFRNQGFATKLLYAAFKDMVENGVYNTTLEVRVHNNAAIEFYLKHGFVKTATKPNYYDNGDDAYFLERRMFDVYNNFSD